MSAEPKLDLNVTSAPQLAVEPAGAGRRFVAAVLDVTILTTMQLPFAVLFVFLFGTEGGESALENVVDRVFSLVSSFVYYGYFYSKKGATPGKMVMGLRLLRDDTGTHLTWAQAFGREFLKGLFFLFTLGISFLMAVFRDDKKTLHDIACKTRVVRIVK